MDDESTKSRSNARSRYFWWAMILGLFLPMMSVVFAPPPMNSIRAPQDSGAMQTTRSIALAMFQYAADHDGNYPTGHSSTEVFQKLIDGKYVDNPSLFYLEMSGKSKPWAHFWSWTLSRHLTPKNVAYDVTANMTINTPESVPNVFATGYRIEYKPGGAAVPAAGEARPAACGDGLPICYLSNNAYYKVTRGPSGVVTNIISADAELGSTTYTQLTPDGPLPSP